MRRSAVITVLMTFVFLAVGEASLRAWAYSFRHPYQRYDSSAHLIRLVPNYDGTPWGSGVHINSRGFRGPEFAKDKLPGVYRIINLGDSVTFGNSNEGCYYSATLGRLLDQEAPGTHFEAINGGVEGYNSRDVLALLEHDVPQYQPDMVTILVGWNDLMKHDPGNPRSSERFARAAYSTYDIYLVKFWRKLIYFYLRPAIAAVETSLSESERSAYQEYRPVVFEENVRRMIAAARSRGIKVVLMTRPSVLSDHMSEEQIHILHFPHYTYNLQKLLLVHSRYNDAVLRLGAAEGVPVLDLEPAFRGKGDLFYDTMHVYCPGQELIAQELARFIQSSTVGASR